MSREVMSIGRSLTVGWRLVPAALCLVASLLLAELLPRLVSLPTIFTTADVVAPTTGVAGLAVAVAVFVAVHEPVDAELQASLPQRLRTAALMRIAVTSAVGIGAVAASSRAALPNTLVCVLTLVGEGLIASSVVGLELAWLTPTAHLIASLVFGAAGRTELASWAFILFRQPGAGSATAAIVLSVLGLVLWCRRI